MVSSQPNNLGANIKRLRTQKGWSQDKLAKEADIPYTTITKIETGLIKAPSVFTVEKIANALDISIEKLIK